MNASSIQNAGLELKPLAFAEAKAFIAEKHRHHKPPQGHKFSIGAYCWGRLVGVAVVGRPIARMADDGFTAEVTRLCTDGHENACSLLYGAAARAAKAMGYRRIITYVLETEAGAPLRASGWVREAKAGGGSWSRGDRPREDKHPLVRKVRWSRQLGDVPVWAGVEAFV